MQEISRYVEKQPKRGIGRFFTAKIQPFFLPLSGIITLCVKVRIGVELKLFRKGAFSTISQFLIISGILLISAYSMANDNQDIEILSLTPKQIKQAIDKHGESKVFRHIMMDNEKASKLLKGIESGKNEWLDFFVQFKKVSDAHWSETLNFSLSYALSNNATRTLAIINQLEKIVRPGGFSGLYAESVCRLLDENWADRPEPHDVLAASALKEINNRINNIKKVNEPQLANVKKRCLDELEYAKFFWSK